MCCSIQVWEREKIRRGHLTSDVYYRHMSANHATGEIIVLGCANEMGDARDSHGQSWARMRRYYRGRPDQAVDPHPRASGRAIRCRRSPSCARRSMSPAPRSARRSARCRRSTSSTSATAMARSSVRCRSTRWSRHSSSAGCSHPGARSTRSARSSRSAWRSTSPWPSASSKAPRTATFGRFRHSSMRWSSKAGAR